MSQKLSNNKRKKDVKVKSYIRNGKVVRAYSRKDEVNSNNQLLPKALISGGIAVAGLGASIFLAKRQTKQITKFVKKSINKNNRVLTNTIKSANNPNTSSIIDSDDVVGLLKEQNNSLQTIVQNQEKIQKNLDKKLISDKVIRDNVDDLQSTIVRQNKTNQEILKRVDDNNKSIYEIAKNQKKNSSMSDTEDLKKMIKYQNEQINRVTKNQESLKSGLQQSVSYSTTRSKNIAGNVNSSTSKQLINIETIDLPKYIHNLSDEKVIKLKDEASKLSDSNLDKTIQRITGNLEKYNKTNYDLSQLESLERAKKQYTKYANDPSRKEYWGKQVKGFADYFKLDSKDISQISYQSNTDPDYYEKLKKVIKRKKNILDIYYEEYKKRNSIKDPRKDITAATDESVQRLFDLVDDFYYLGDIVNFTKKKNYYFLGDITK